MYSSDDYRGAILRLMPRGAIWSREQGSLPYAVSWIWSQTIARLDARAFNLLVDAFPSTTTELLPEWQQTLGLPDACAGTNPTLAQQRSQVVARLTDNGGCSQDYFIAYAATLGYTITITQFWPSKFGKKFGTSFGGKDWAYTWQVNAPQFTVQKLKFGDLFGKPFASWGDTVLQCELERLCPPYTILLFNYS